MSAKEVKNDKGPGVIFTCVEEPARSSKTWRRGWTYRCFAFGEQIASGPAKTQAEARQKNRDAKEAYLADLTARGITDARGSRCDGNPEKAIQVKAGTELEGVRGQPPAGFVSAFS